MKLEKRHVKIFICAILGAAGASLGQSYTGKAWGLGVGAILAGVIAQLIFRPEY